MKTIQVTLFCIAQISIILIQCGVSKANNFDIFHRNRTNEITRRNFKELAAECGYQTQEYEVVTQDGYILTLFRLPGRSAVPVLLMHGLLDSADTWLLRGNNSGGIALANQGYDLWVGNVRGNIYARHHVSLNPDTDDEFWNFSFHEHGYYDLPAIIDRVLNETGASNLTAIGHSQGSSIFNVLGSTRSEYNEKINLMIALAPFCYVKNVRHPLPTYLKLVHIIEPVLKELQIYEVLGYNTTIDRLFRFVCSIPTIGYHLCFKIILFPVIGFDVTEFEPSFASGFVYHFPVGTSLKNLVHYSQEHSSGAYAQYDYGADANMLFYNSSTPPIYDLSKVTMPVALFASRNDPLSTLKDVGMLRRQLANVVDFEVSPRPLFNHGDHVWGRRMYEYLFPYLFRILHRFNRI